MNVKHPYNMWRDKAPPRQAGGTITHSASCCDPLLKLINNSGTEATSGCVRLLNDTFNIELSSGERRLLQVLALYRRAVPQIHRSMLEHHLSAAGAWTSLISRNLLTSAAKPWHVMLRPHVRDRLLYAVFSYDREQIDEFHGVIASCWLKQLDRNAKATTSRKMIACEALYHLSSAGDEQRLWQIPPELLSIELQWALMQLKNFYNDLYRSKSPVHRQRSLLQYRVLLEPENHVIHRFLGQCWQKEEWKGSSKAISCFEAACRLKPDYPPYWADLGQALMATGRAGASDFLARLKHVEKEYPAAINDYVRSVRTACIRVSAGSEAARAIRREEISSGSGNPAYYADEAKEQIKRGNPAQALEVIELAEKQGCANDITTAIKCAALEDLGKKLEASEIRLEKMALGSRCTALYCDEAKARLAEGDPDRALAIIDLAITKGLVSDHLTSIRTTALQRVGNSALATAIRMAKIEAGIRNCVYYNDEAKARMSAGDLKGAKEMLELAVQYDCANQVTSVLWNNVVREEGKKKTGNRS